MATILHFFPLAAPQTRRISRTPRTLRNVIEANKKSSQSKLKLYTVNSPVPTPTQPSPPPVCIADCQELAHVNPQYVSLESLVENKPVTFRELSFILAALAAITLKVKV